MSNRAARPDVPASMDVLWGAKAIAAFMGCGVDAVYGMAADPTAPVHKRRGRLYAFRSDLVGWLRAPKRSAEG